MASREAFSYTAKLAEQTERYLDVELTVEESNLLSVGYKNVLRARLASWSIVSSIEQKDSKGNESHVKKIREYRQKVQSELSNICTDIMAMIDEHLIPSAGVREPSMFYYKMKGDYYWYLTEFKTGNEKEVTELLLKAYQGHGCSILQFWRQEALIWKKKKLFVDD